MAHLLAGRGLGTRRRRYGHIAGVKPGIAEWTEFLSLPGADGGLAAPRVDFEAERARWVASLDPLPPRTPCHTRAGQEDLFLVGRQLRYSPRRRASPSWSLPAEVYLMCIRPFYTTGRKAVREGVGFVRPEDDMSYSVVPDFFAEVFIQVRRGGQAPAIAHVIHGHAIPKPAATAAQGVQGLRMVHMLCSFWKCWYGAMLRIGMRITSFYSHVPPWVFGFRPHGRREDPMVAQRILRERLRRIGQPHMTMLTDMKNAFGAVDQSAVIRDVGAWFVQGTSIFLSSALRTLLCE